MREGPTLNKELIGVSNLINSFTDKVTEAPYADCKTNLLLQETLGGNCVSFGIICLDVSSNKLLNKAILQYASKLNQIENFPVINNDRMRGLLMKYHKRYHNVLRQLEAIKKQHSANVDDHAVNHSNIEVKLLEFRSSLIEKEKELIALHGDKDKLRESYSQFRSKYAELVNKKTALQHELILSEEKCLNISKTLIDLQIENNDLKKNESVIRADLETKLIGAENDILETGMREQNLSEDIAKLRMDTNELLAEKKTLSIEYVALRSNYMNLNTEHDELKEEQQHLNVQLINLINANKTLEETATRLTQENESLLSKNETFETGKESTIQKYKNMESEIVRIKTLSEKQAIEIIKAEVEVSRMKTALDAAKSEYQKKFISLSKDRDTELQTVTNQRTSEVQHNRAEKQQLERDVETLKGQIRVANRQITNFKQKSIEYEEEILMLTKESNKFRDLLKEKTEEFRMKLLSYLQRVKTTKNSVNVEDLKVTQNKLYEELTSTHNERERELMLESENERKKNRKLHNQLQTVTERLVLLQDFLKDVAPDAQLPHNAIMKSLELNDMNDMNRKMQQHDEKVKEKIANLGIIHPIAYLLHCS